MNKQIESFASDLVRQYAEFNGVYHELSMRDLPCFVRSKFIALIMSNDSDLAHEAIGADNPSFEKIMLPALLAHLKNPIDRDTEIEFCKAWQLGLEDYLEHTIQELLSDKCSEYDFDRFPSSPVFYHADNSEYRGISL